MIHQATHYIEPGAKRAVCGRGLNAPEFVGRNRNRKQFKLTCVGGPWDGQEAVFPEQDGTPLSLPIRVGEHVGQYNLNTGAWVPMEQQA